MHRDGRINAINDPSRHQKVLAGDEAGTCHDGIHHAGATASEKTGGGDLGMLNESNAWAHHYHWEPAVRTDRDPAAGHDAFGSQLQICVRSLVPQAGRAARLATFSLDRGVQETRLPPTLSLGLMVNPLLC